MKTHAPAITKRDRELFQLLAAARWLSTRQVHRRFFPSRSVNAVNKRLRKLVDGGFLRMSRPDRTAEAYVRLGSASRSLLDGAVTIPKRLPKHLEHFRRINDVRLWFLQQQDSHGLPLTRFAAEWEFRNVGQAWPVVPDGLALLGVPEGRGSIAVEVDCATEPVALFRDKMRHYLDPDSRFRWVLIGAPGWRRVRSLVRALYDTETGRGPTWLLVDLERLEDTSVSARGFIALNRPDDSDESVLVSVAEDWGCPDRLSGRQETQSSPQDGQSTTYEETTVRN